MITTNYSEGATCSVGTIVAFPSTPLPVSTACFAARAAAVELNFGERHLDSAHAVSTIFCTYHTGASTAKQAAASSTPRTLVRPIFNV